MKSLNPVYYLGLTKETSIKEFISFCINKIEEIDLVVQDSFLLTTSFTSYPDDKTLGELLENEMAFVFIRTEKSICIFDVTEAKVGYFFRSSNEEEVIEVFSTLKSINKMLDAINLFTGDKSVINLASAEHDIDLDCKVTVNYKDVDILFKTEEGNFVGKIYRAEDRIFRIYSEDGSVVK